MFWWSSSPIRKYQNPSSQRHWTKMSRFPCHFMLHFFIIIFILFYYLTTIIVITCLLLWSCFLFWFFVCLFFSSQQLLPQFISRCFLTGSAEAMFLVEGGGTVGRKRRGVVSKCVRLKVCRNKKKSFDWVSKHCKTTHHKIQRICMAFKSMHGLSAFTLFVLCWSLLTCQLLFYI